MNKIVIAYLWPDVCMCVYMLYHCLLNVLCRLFGQSQDCANSKMLLQSKRCVRTSLRIILLTKTRRHIDLTVNGSISPCYNLKLVYVQSFFYWYK